MTSALKPYLARSAGLHAASLAAFLLLAPRALIKTDKVYMIDFVGGAPTIQSAGPASAPSSKAEPEAQKPAPQVDPDSLAPKGRRGFALPRPSLLKGWTQRSDPPRPSLRPADSVAGASDGAAGGAGSGMPSGAAGITTDMPNFPYPWYISQVRQMLWTAWRSRMPPSTTEGVVVFAIRRNGMFTDLRMESSSGDIAFDAAALESVQAASPYPALPADFPEPFLKIHLTLKSEASWR
ncbi:MAG: TonB family protein [Elusimicrobiota bacterium]